MRTGNIGRRGVGRWAAVVLGSALVAACGSSGGQGADLLADATDAGELADTTSPAGGDAQAADPGPEVALDAAAGAETSGGDTAPADTAEGPPPDALEAALLDPDHLVEVAIDMAPWDWDSLRHQTRTIFDALGPGCLDRVAPNPFTWFRAEVTLEGYSRGDVGVRKKGFLGSMSTDKPSLKVDFDTFVDGQRVGDVERLTLNNCVQDPAYLRQCLAYEVFARAGVPAPRCAFGLVRVNGGPPRVYANIEPVKKRFLRRHFDSDEGLLYEGTLSDFRPGWMATFEQKTQEDAPTQAPLEAVVAALDAPDDELAQALDAVIDLDGFFTFWAVEVLVGHWDGYASNTNNYYVYAAPHDDGRLHFIPWGTDGAFPTGEQDAGVAVARTTGALARRLFMVPETRARFAERLGALLDSAWDPAWLQGEIDRMDAIVRPHLEPGALQPYVAARQGVAAFVAKQRARLTGELQAIASMQTGPLRDAPCMKPAGSVTLTLHTRWGTLGKENPFIAGSGEGELEFAGQSPPLVQVGALLGPDPESGDGSLAILQVFVQPPGDRIWVANVPVVPGQIIPGAVLPVDGEGVAAYVFTIDAVTYDKAQLVGALGDGTLTIDNGAPLAGAEFDVRLDATLFGLGF